MDDTRSPDADTPATVDVDADVDADADADAAMDAALDSDTGVAVVTRANSASRGSSRCASFTAPVATAAARPDCICFGDPWLAEATGAPCASADCIDSTPSSATQIVLGKKDREENESAFMVQRSRSDGSNKDGI